MDDKQLVFLKRFDKTNKWENNKLAGILWSNEVETSRSQKFTDKLKTICAAFENEGCPIKRQKGKGGRCAKGESLPDQVYKQG